MSSSTLLAIEIKIWIKLTQPENAIFVIANDNIIMVYSSAKKSVIMSPFNISQVMEVNFADQVPSACSLQVNKEVEDKIGRSHLIMESKSMGLLLKYIIERNYAIDIDFCNTIIISNIGVDKVFSFSQLEEIK